MKDYKGRGSNLQFRERRSTPRGRLLKLGLPLLLLAAIGFLAYKWLNTEDKPSIAPSTAAAIGHGIPLTLPPAPESYGADQSTGD
jgi:hypothetical protein